MKTNDQGRIELHITDGAGKALNEQIVVILNENAAQFGHAVRLRRDKDGEISGEVPAGSYTLQALAKGYDAGHEFVEIHAGRTHKSSMKLTKGVEHPRTSVAERLEKRYGIKPAKENLQNLTVNRGERVSLNYRNYRDPAHVQVLRPKSVDDLKRWVGSPSGVFPGNHPRFGALSPIKDAGGGRATLSPDQQVGLNAIANEYLYGNAQAVPEKDLAALSNRFIQATVFVPIFYYMDVVILDGATLEVGNGSSVFVCDTLTIHPKGTLRAVGDVRADISLLVQL